MAERSTPSSVCEADEAAEAVVAVDVDAGGDDDDDADDCEGLPLSAIKHSIATNE